MSEFIRLLYLVSLAWTGFAMDDGETTGPPKNTLRTEAVRRGDLAVTVQATGTVEPQEVADVGPKVAGQITRFGADPRDPKKSIDYGTLVEEGTILAQIDPTIYKLKVEQAQAQVEKCQAALELAEIHLRQAENAWKRAEKPSANKAMPREEVDDLHSRYDAVKSEVAVAKADVRLARATLKEAQVKLDYTTIRSPITGVIIDRRVNVGQYVAPTANAPGLFLIAKGQALQVWASVKEADISCIHAGQAVRFSVDAYPKEVFAGKVAQVRLNATVTQNVVTYTVVVETDNSAGKLLPYQTAHLEFGVGTRKPSVP
jgi:HlyD family secretion protein